MKKISIKIKEPCHENWEAMTKQEKGKFCGSCQKTVIDFTAMSDRQIAEFFKKPAGSVCGRLHYDQLQRPMEIPKKRIPWVKYFFHITWPAFVLFLKGCGERENIVGKVATANTHNMRSNELRAATVGYVMPEIMSVDSAKINQQAEIIDTKNAVVEVTKVEPPQPILIGDTIAKPVEDTKVLEEGIKEVKAMDTVNIVGYATISCRYDIAGLVSVVREKEKTKEVKQDIINYKIETVEVTASPNPARAGSQITIVSSANNVINQLQLFSSSGAMIKTTQANTLNYENAKFNIPS